MSTRIMPVGKLSHLLKKILGDTALDIQHVGSTSICSISAKPIIDIAIAVNNLNDILPYIDLLKQHNIIFRGEMIAGEILFVMGDDGIRTHHIHIVKWIGAEWNNSINFRDYLNECPEKAILYDTCKQKLAMQFSNDRKSYTAGKEKLYNVCWQKLNFGGRLKSTTTTLNLEW